MGTKAFLWKDRCSGQLLLEIPMLQILRNSSAAQKAEVLADLVSQLGCA